MDPVEQQKEDLFKYYKERRKEYKERQYRLESYIAEQCSINKYRKNLR